MRELSKNESLTIKRNVFSDTFCSLLATAFISGGVQFVFGLFDSCRIYEAGPEINRLEKPILK